MPRPVPSNLISNIGRRTHRHIKSPRKRIWRLRPIMCKGERAAKELAWSRELNVRRGLGDGARELEDRVKDSSFRRHLCFSMGTFDEQKSGQIHQTTSRQKARFAKIARCHVPQQTCGCRTLLLELYVKLGVVCALHIIYIFKRLKECALTLLCCFPRENCVFGCKSD